MAVMFIAVLVLVGSLAGIALMLDTDDNSPVPEIANAVALAPPPQDDQACAAPPTPDDILARRLEAAASTEDEIQAMTDYAKAGGATSASLVLQQQMITGGSEDSRVKAFQILLELSGGEDRNAVTDVLTRSVNNPHPEVRRQGLYSCCDHPRYELVDDLMDIAESGGPDRHLAIRALAFTDDPGAQRKVLETAQSEDVSRAERVQAITLLSQTNLNECVSYLQDLVLGEDKELKRYAMEALAIWQKRQKE